MPALHKALRSELQRRSACRQLEVVVHHVEVVLHEVELQKDVVEHLVVLVPGIQMSALPKA
jgi:hypothetical protein